MTGSVSEIRYELSNGWPSAYDLWAHGRFSDIVDVCDAFSFKENVFPLSFNRKYVLVIGKRILQNTPSTSFSAGLGQY